MKTKYRQKHFFNFKRNNNQILREFFKTKTTFCSAFLSYSFNRTTLKKQQPIIEEDFLKNHLNLFHLSTIDGLESKKVILNDWFLKYRSGKLEGQNETSIAADFINDIFGDVLGFNYRNPNNWNLQKELKTLIDSRKPDGAIGYFNVEEDLSTNVYGVIEMKSANTNLDKKQNRADNKQTPVEQAFSYAPKYGKKCKWVIVSNFVEIRLYKSDDASKYEAFYLDQLKDEYQLKRFFFLLKIENLLSKDGTPRLERLIEKSREFKSQMANKDSSHILDRIYNLIKKFDGLMYVNPNILANAMPFNKGNRYVHHYSSFTLESTEKDIFSLFSGITIESQKILLSEPLRKELTEWGVVEFQDKISFLIKRFNECLIFKIRCYENVDLVHEHLSQSNSSIEGILSHEMRDYCGQMREFSIDLSNHETRCECLRCCYKRLDFSTVLKTLKAREGKEEHNTLESGYFHHIVGTNRFKTSFLIYKNIARQEKGGNQFLYFIAKYNLLRLHNLVDRAYSLEDKEEIMNEIKSIDLDAILHELDVIDLDQRKALIEIKDETIKKNTEKNIEEKIINLKKAKASFERGPDGSFPDYTFQLNKSLAAFLSHYSTNYILGDTFTGYKNLCKKVLEGYLISYSSHGYPAQLKQLEIFHVNLIVFDLYSETVKELCKTYKINDIALSENAKNDLLEKVKNFLQSNHGRIIWFEPIENVYLIQALTSLHFKQIYEHIFFNLFFLLSRTELTEDQCRTFIPVIIPFLKADNTLYAPRLKTLSKFITKYGNYFKSNELTSILSITLDKRRLSDNSLIKAIFFALNTFHSDFKLEDEVIIQKGILRSIEDHKYHDNLVLFWAVSTDTNKKILETEFFKKLDRKFAPYFYRTLLFYNVINIDYKDYFCQYVKSVNASKGNGNYKLWNGEPNIRNFDFINFALLLYSLNIDTNDTRIKQLSNLCEWHNWLINLDSFDYSKFKVEWVLIFHHEVILKRLGDVPIIRNKVKKELTENYHPRLADIYIKYLNK